jgi:hypothetical protein
MAWGGVAAAPVFQGIAEHTMRLLRVPPEDNRTRMLADPRAPTVDRNPLGSALPTISVGNFVENMRGLLNITVTHLSTSIWEHFFSIDPKEARKSRRKADKADK